MSDANFKQRLDRQAVLLSITGVQKDAQGEQERIELITKGQLYEKSGVSYIIYKEHLSAGGKGNNSPGASSATMLKLCPEYMTLLRSGSVEQRQDFRPGQLCTSRYITPYGSFDMAVLTNNFLLSRSEYGKISGIDVEYDLHMDGHWQSTNTLSIIIKEEEANGHQSHAGPGN